jgi:hypothetical protein
MFQCYVYVNIVFTPKLGDDIVVLIFQTMDLLEASNTKSLANSLHEFLNYHKHLE